MKASQSLLQVFQSRKMAALLLLGFSSGLPLYLTSRTLQAWMQEEKVDLASIGLFSLVGLPYSLKFLWSPLFFLISLVAALPGLVLLPFVAPWKPRPGLDDEEVDFKD